MEICKMLNKCDFIGRLGQDPEVRYMQDGKAAANISIGCSEKWKDKVTSEQKEKTEWVKCSAFGKLAEIMGEYLRKGSLVYVSGKMQTRKWQDQSGVDRYTTEIIINDMKMLGSKPESQGGNQPQQQQQAPQQQYQQPQQQQQRAPQQQQRAPQQTQAQPQYNEPPMDFDDDIPFAPIGLMHNNNLMHCI